jgi:MYXO-CTERM domain-containing protein
MKRLIARGTGLTLLVAVVAFAGSAAAAPFSYDPPGQLIAGSGKGRADLFVYAPGMRFPIEAAPAFANSQVYKAGGGQGPGGSQCSTSNFSYPWQDNYCETRSWDMPLCPSGTGHQGQDIRAATCDKDVHWAVATTDGKITNVGSYSVYLTDSGGTRYDYLHMGSVQVTVGQTVTKGKRLGRVSNVFGGTPTTVHLHFNLRQNVSGVGNVYVPPYMSLIKAYEGLVGPVNKAPVGLLDPVDCASGVRGFVRDPDALAQSIEARLVFDGADPKAYDGDRLADLMRDELCEPLGYCNLGFEVPVPASLLDGAPHELRAFGLDTGGGPPAEVEDSPRSFTCGLPALDGVRRLVGLPDGFSAWSFSAFWDQVSVGDAALAALPNGEALPSKPALVRSDTGSADVWLIDGPWRRKLPSEAALRAWHFDPSTVVEWAQSDLDALAIGTPVRPRPLLVKASGPEIYLVDDLQTGGTGAGGGGGAGGATATGAATTSGTPSDGAGAAGAGGADSGGGARATSTSAGGSSDAPGSSESAEGCGCRLEPSPASRGWRIVAAAAAAAWLVRRRKR